MKTLCKPASADPTTNVGVVDCGVLEGDQPPVGTAYFWGHVLKHIVAHIIIHVVEYRSEHGGSSGGVAKEQSGCVGMKC